VVLQRNLEEESQVVHGKLNDIERNTAVINKQISKLTQNVPGIEEAKNACADRKKALTGMYSQLKSYKNQTGKMD
jgi:hypothetical protein